MGMLVRTIFFHVCALHPVVADGSKQDVVWKMEAAERPPPKKSFVPHPEEVNLLQKSLDVDSHMARVNRSGFDLLGGLKDLIKSFKELDKCLNQQPKYKIMSLLDFFTSRLSQLGDPGKVWNDFSKTYLQDALDSAKEWTEQELNAALAKTKALIIGKKKVLKIDAGHVATLIDDVWAAQDRLFAKKGFLPVKCLNDAFIAPHKQPLKKLLVQFVDVVLKPVVQWFENIMKTAMDWINSAVSGLINRAGFKAFEERLKDHAEAIAAESCSKSISDSTKGMLQAAANKDFSAANSIYKAIRGPIPVSIIGKVAASALSLILGDIFSKVMEVTVQPVMSWVLGGLSSLLTTVGNGIEGACGLIPEAGSMVCAMIVAPLDYAQNWVTEHLGKGAVTLIENYFKKLVSYSVLEPPITKALRWGLKRFSAEIAGTLKKVNIPGLKSWLRVAQRAIGRQAEKLAKWVLPTVTKALTPCKQARNKLASSARFYSKKRQMLLESDESSARVLMPHEEEILQEPLFGGASMNLDERTHHGNWLLSIPWEPAPQHAVQWREERESLLQMHRELTSIPESALSEVASLVDVNASAGSSTGKIWLGKSCVKESWKYDKWGKNIAYWTKKCGWWGCIPVLKFRWRFGWKRIGAGACEYGNNAWNLANWWCPKHRRVQQADFLNPFNFERCLDDENWFDQILKSMDMLPNILKVVENMDGCMRKLKGLDAKWKLSSIVDFYVKRAVDPIRLLKDIDTEYLAPTLKNLEPWFQKTVKSGMKDGKEFMKHIQNKSKNLDEAWALGVVDKGWDMIASERTGLVSVKGMGALRCLKRRFGGPIYRASRPFLAKAVLDVVVPAAQWLTTKLKQIEAWFQEKVSEAVNGDNWFSQLVKMVRAAIFKVCLKKYINLDYASIAKANPKLDLTKVAVELVPPFFEKVKVWSLFHVVEPIAHHVGQASRDIGGMISHSMDGLAGLIPFWGGLVGALMTSAQNAGKRLETAFSQQAIMKGFEQVFAWIQREAVKQIKKGMESIKGALNGNPLGQVVMELIQKGISIVGGPLVMECQNSIESLVTMDHKSKAKFKEMRDKLLGNFSTTPPPPPTPRPTPSPTKKPPPPPPTPRPTPSPTLSPTPVPTIPPKDPTNWWNGQKRGPWSHCWENHECKNNISTTYGNGNFQKGVDHIQKKYSHMGVRRRDSWRDNCIELSCHLKGVPGYRMTWKQEAWRDCGNWRFSGLCHHEQ